MSSLANLLQQKKNILSIYFTAGFPKLNDTADILRSLEKSGADLIELGMPYSDPLADGPVIQQSSEQALQNGMSIPVLFDQLKKFRETDSAFSTPIILMGYLNPVLQFGAEKFCLTAKSRGIDSFIIPDMTPEIYEKEFRQIFETTGIVNIFLITPQTTEERIRKIESLSKSFIYVVSSAGVTGFEAKDDSKEKYFAKLQSMNIQNPLLIGFGISSHKDYLLACKYAQGAIIGSSYIRQLEKGEEIDNTTSRFINSILHEST